MLAPLPDGLWELNAPLTVFGIALGHRMTVAQIGNDSLWVHSPVAWSESLADGLACLGTVGHIVAPSCVHDTYLESWFAAYPQARLYGAEDFPRHRPDLKFHETLSDSPPATWAGTFRQRVMRGAPRLNETLFLHLPSHTLILTDLCFNLGPDMPFLSRTLLRLMQVRPVPLVETGDQGPRGISKLVGSRARMGFRSDRRVSRRKPGNRWQSRAARGLPLPVAFQRSRESEATPFRGSEKKAPPFREALETERVGAGTRT
jgi:Domain of unknown function (DUF4336)